MRQSLALLLMLLLAPLPSLQSSAFVVHAFAEWTKCWTELEEGEIIMNQPVQRPKGPNADASDNDDTNDDGGMVRLVALDANGRTAKPIHTEGNCDAATDEADDDTCQSKSNAAIPFAPGQTFHIKMRNSVTNEGGQPHPPPNTQYLAQTSEGGKFLGRSSLCDGTRAVGRRRDDVVRIQLTGEQDVVKVWAGYASEKAAVILTPELVFRLDPSDSGDREGNAGAGAPARNPAPAPAPAPAPSPTPSVPSQLATAPVMPPDL